MFLQRLPKSFNVRNEITPPVFTDHFLFTEEVKQPYECPELPAAIGLLVAAGGVCQYRVNGTRYPVDGGHVFFVNRGSPLHVRANEKGVRPALLFFHSRLPDLVQFSLSFGGEVRGSSCRASLASRVVTERKTAAALPTLSESTGGMPIVSMYFFQPKSGVSADS